MIHFINTIELTKLRKYILIVSILVISISFIVLIFWNNIITELLFSTILISLSINVFSTLLLFYLLDRKESENQEKIYKEKQKVILETSLIPTIKDFYVFILHMYRDIKNTSNNINTFDIFDDFNKFYKNIINLDLKAESYEAKVLDSDILETYQYTWYESCILHFSSYINDIIRFKSTYYSFINEDILKNLNIIESKIRELNSFKHICKAIKFSDKIRKDITKIAFESIGLNDILIATNNIAYLINENNVFWLDESIITRAIQFVNIIV